MSLTTTTVTHTVVNADGTAGSGVIEFTLTKMVTNGATTVLPAPIAANLDGSGHLSVALYANNDAGTLPEDSQYRVDFRLLFAGSQEQTFYIIVPTGGGTVELGTLLPQDAIGA